MFADNIQTGHTICPLRKADDPHTGMFEARFFKVDLWLR
jgi:hypothetical protein